MGKTEELTIVDIYNRSTTEGKVKYMLDNYSSFIQEVDAYEYGLIGTIKAERRYNRRKSLGDTGVKIQTSGISNPTASSGEEDEIVATAVKSGDYITALRGADKFERHKLEILTLRNMREDFGNVKNQVTALKDKEALYRRYLKHEFDLDTIADSEGVTKDAMKQRFRKIRKKVSKGAVFWINQKYDYYVLKKGA